MFPELESREMPDKRTEPVAVVAAVAEQKVASLLHLTLISQHRIQFLIREILPTTMPAAVAVAVAVAKADKPEAVDWAAAVAVVPSVFLFSIMVLTELYRIVI